MSEEPNSISPNENDAPFEGNVEPTESFEGALRILEDRIGHLEAELSEIRQRAEAQDDRHADLSGVVDGIGLRLAESPFGNRMVNVGSSLDLKPLQGEMERHAALLAETPLSGALTSRQVRHLLIPIHSPKLNYISGLFARIDSAGNQHDIRCTFIATSSAEREIVERYIALTRPAMPDNYEVISAIDLARVLGMNHLAAAMLENRNGGIINMKKMLALYRACCEGAEEICCIDSDSAFLKPLGEMFEICKNNYNNKKFIAVSTENEIAKKVVEVCSSYFSLNDKRRLEEFYYRDLYSWFYDIPYYSRKDILDFFNHIIWLNGSIDRSFGILEWSHFEHVLYINYLILRGDFQICDVSCFVAGGRLSDDLRITDLKCIEQQLGFMPVWATLSALLVEQETGHGDGFCAVFHVDRLAQ